MARSKKKAQNIHAKRRAIERYGLSLNKFALKEMVRQIQSGKAQFLERSSIRVTKWLVKHEGQMIPVVYDNKSHTVVTFLPDDARELKNEDV